LSDKIGIWETPERCANQVGGQLVDCLFINATKINIASINGLMLSRVTSFMTKVAPDKTPHACLQLGNPPSDSPASSITNSIFYGGIVAVAPTTNYYTNNNFQFATTGNTAFLSGEMVDPMFVSNVGQFKNHIPIADLINADFSLQSSSPAQGSGSSTSSVAKLLSTF